MENLIKHFDTVATSFRRMRFATIASIILAAVVALGSFYLATTMVSKSSDTVYVLDKGTALAASASSGKSQRDLEAGDHFTRFCELMFNQAPSKESIDRNINRALEMADKSAYDYYADQSERGFYKRLISANIIQQFVSDSVKVDVTRYPYTGRLYGKVYLVRESNITAFALEASCNMVDVSRTTANPHGLLIENFVVERMDNQGSRKR